MQQLGRLLKDWGLLPKNHNIDEKILMSVIDKDRDNHFSFEDFVNNFPRYNSEEVEKFVEEKKHKDELGSLVSSEFLESIVSLDSDSARKEVDKFEFCQSMRRLNAQEGKDPVIKSNKTQAFLVNDEVRIPRIGTLKRNAMRVQMAVQNEPMNQKIVSGFLKHMKNQVEHKKLIDQAANTKKETMPSSYRLNKDSEFRLLKKS